MKSRLISLCNYRFLPLENLQEVIESEELTAAVNIDMESLRLQNTYTKEVDSIAYKDIAEITMKESSSLVLVKSFSIKVGLNLFDPVLEQALIGRKKAESFSCILAGKEYDIKILHCYRTCISEKLTDSMVESLSLPDIYTVKDYEFYLRAYHKEEFRQSYLKLCVQNLLRLWRNASQVEYDSEELHDWYEQLHPGGICSANKVLIELEKESTKDLLFCHLVYFFLSHQNSNDMFPNLNTHKEIIRIQESVLKPLYTYLQDFVTILVKEN